MTSKNRVEYQREYRKKNHFARLIYRQIHRLAFIEEYHEREKTKGLFNGRKIVYPELKGLEKKEYQKRYYLKVKKTLVIGQRERAKEREVINKYGDFSKVVKSIRNLYKEILCQEKQRARKL